MCAQIESNQFARGLQEEGKVKLESAGFGCFLSAKTSKPKLTPHALLLLHTQYHFNWNSMEFSQNN